jgi:hypothetical protein
MVMTLFIHTKSVITYIDSVLSDYGVTQNLLHPLQTLTESWFNR